MVAMTTALFTVYCKLFHMMLYIIILKVRKFHQPTASRFSTARKKPVGGTLCPPPSLNRVKHLVFVILLKGVTKSICTEGNHGVNTVLSMGLISGTTELCQVLNCILKLLSCCNRLPVIGF